MLGEHEGGEAIYVQTPKPPVPFISARELVLTFWKDKSMFGEGKRVLFGRSTTKEGAPINSSNVLTYAKVFASIIEADGAGSKMTELRTVDMGNTMAIVVDKASKAMPIKGLEGWHKGVDKKD